MNKLFDCARTSGLACILALGVCFPLAGARAQSFSVLYTFTGGTNGEFPQTGMTTDGQGNLLGTTFGSVGGAPGKSCSKSCGTQFSYNITSGMLSTPFYFGGGSGGAFPAGDPVYLAPQTTVYGTTEYGGGTSCSGIGCGTIFAIQTTTGTTKALYRFCWDQFPDCTAGALPFAGPILDPDGKYLYGTTTLGGTVSGISCDSNFRGCGTVYRITADLTHEKVLYSFCQLTGCADGAVPAGKLVEDSSGDLFGTTQFGGDSGNGVIFELQYSGGSYSYRKLYSFCPSTVHGVCMDGAVPEAGLYEDSSGNLFGSTFYGGARGCHCGVLFEFSSAGTYSVLYRFLGGTSDGAFPQAPLIADQSGNLYGTTLRGGGGAFCKNKAIYCGTVFQWVPGAQAPTILYAFGQSFADGAQPVGTLQINGGTLYGVARLHGDLKCNCGVLYGISGVPESALNAAQQANAVPARRVDGTISVQRQFAGR